MRARGKSLKVAGLDFLNLVTVVIGLVGIGVGLVIGAVQGHAMGGMVGLVIGVQLIVIALIFKEND
jgi:hypothetical protein